MRRAGAGLAALAALVACSKTTAPRSSEIEGTLSIGGRQAALVECRPRRELRTYVDVVTSAGVLRFADQQLWWNPDARSSVRGAPLTCTRLDRSWGGGGRADGSAYWRGTLSFDCARGEVAFVGDLTLDCGNITAAERAQLDAQRARMREQQRAPRPGSGAGSGS